MPLSFQDYHNRLKESDDLAFQGISILENFQPSPNDIIETKSIHQRLLDEGVVTVVTVTGMILAAPTALKTIINVGSLIFKSIWKLLGKKVKDEYEFAKTLITFADKWYHKYISVVVRFMEVTGIFTLLGIVEDTNKKLYAETIYTLILFGTAANYKLAAPRVILQVFKHVKVSFLNMEIVKEVLNSTKMEEVKKFLGLMKIEKGS